MALFFLGIALLLVGLVLILAGGSIARSMSSQPGFPANRRPPNLRGLGFIALVAGIILPIATSVRVIGATEVGIPVTFGKIGTPLNPGFNIVLPWTEITSFSTRLQVSDMNRAGGDGDRAGDDSVTVLSSEGGELNIDVTVRYSVRPSEAADLFRRVRSMEGVRDIIVRPETRSQMRNVYSRYTAEEGYTTKREEIERIVFDEIRKRLDPQGLVLDEVAVRDIRPADQILAAINRKLEATQAAERAKIEQQRALTEAETRRRVAETDKQARVIAAQGEAEANSILQESLSPELLKAREIEAIANNGNAVIYPYGQPVTPIVDGRGSARPTTTAPPANGTEETPTTAP
jgi:regulator of protease activity HflC (stomatin/prohibitin superfamily)